MNRRLKYLVVKAHRPSAFVAVCVLLSVLLLSLNWAVFNASEGVAKWDEHYHIAASKLFKEKPAFDTISSFEDSKGPLYHIIYGTFLSFVDGGLVGARFITVCSSVLTCAVFSCFLVKVRSIDFPSFLCLLLFPYYGRLSVLHMSESITLLFLVIALAVGVGRTSEIGGRARFIAPIRAVLSCFAIALASGIRLQSLSFAGAYFLDEFRNQKKVNSVIYVATGILVVIVYYAILGGRTRKIWHWGQLGEFSLRFGIAGILLLANLT